MITYHPPLHSWTRHHPLPRAIAVQLTSEMLQLRTQVLVKDIRQRFGVAPCTAMKAVSIARKRLEASGV